MRLSFLPVLFSLSLTAAAQAQPTTFTYQGRLKNGAQLAAGLHDLRFRLFDASSGGTQVGTTQCADNVAVSDGLFTAQIDFGQQYATTAQRFLEIEVRADTGLNCTNATGFTLLSPRQLLTAAPMASHAKTAFSLAAADGSPANAVVVDNDGKVGIGTTTPTHTVHIASPEPTLALQDTDSNLQQVGYVSYRDSGNIERAWVGYGSAASPVFSIVNARSAGHIALLPLAGNVGIGTSAPSATLDVRGAVRFGPAAQYLAVGGTANVHIVRGTVTSAGVKIAGEGFSVTHPGTGDYTITFNTPFTFRPTVTATAEWVSGGTAVVASTDVVSTTSMNIVLVFTTNSGLTDREFSFIAIGNH